MTGKKWNCWAAAIATTCILAGCGGDSDSDTSPALAGDTPSHRVAKGIGGPVHNASLQDDAFSDKEMVGFMPLDERGMFNSGLKFVIASLGPQKLLGYMESWKSNTLNADERRFAEKSIDLIQKAYNSPVSLSAEVRDVGESLISLPLFKSINALGNNISQEQLVEALRGFDFPELLPEWSIETTEVDVHQGANRVLGQVTRQVPLVLGVDLNDAVTGTAGNIGLQQALDLIHQDHYKDGQGKLTADPYAAMTKDMRLVRVADVADFDRLVIFPSTGNSSGLDFNAQERATLPVFDEKTQKKMLLTLQPSVAIVHLPQANTYQAFIKNGCGEWKVHADTHVAPLSTANSEGKVALLTLTVIEAVPAP